MSAAGPLLASAAFSSSMGEPAWYRALEDFFDQPWVGVAADWSIAVSAALIAFGILFAHWGLWNPFPRLRRFIRERWMVVDLRAAGLFRIVLGTLLTLDTIRHANEARLLYSNSGVLTNDYHQWQPTARFQFSIFETFSTLNEVRVLFALGVISSLLLLVGYRSRLFAFVCFVFTTSMDVRIPFVENGGYIVVNLACFWSVFLPIGERFSIDAWRASWRARREKTIDDLNDRSSPTSDPRYVSWIGLMALFNLGIVYFWNVVNKAGGIWRKGETVHYVLYLSRMITGLAAFMRKIMPMWLLRPIDWFVLAVEASICVLIISPRSKRYTRPLAMALMVALHATFGFMMRLGPFSWFLIGCSTLLLCRENFADLRAWYERRAPRWEVGVADAPLAMGIARVLKRLDGWERLTFSPLESQGGSLLAIRRAPAEGDAPFTTDARSVARGIGAALPLGKYLFPIVNVLTLGGPARLLQRDRPKLTRFFAIGEDLPETRPPSPVGAFLRKHVFRVRESFLAFMAFAFLAQTLWEQKSIPTQIKPESRPDFLSMPIEYPRLFQGWGMFAPNPIQEDGILVVDAYTIDGRRIDPYNESEVDLDITDDTSREISQLRQDYGNRIRLDHNKHYRDGIRNWLSEYHVMTGRPGDEIVAFDVYWVRDKCPAVGQKKPTNNDPVALFSWRKPGYKRPPEMIKIPPQPKIRSAEKWDEPGTPQ